MRVHSLLLICNDRRCCISRGESGWPDNSETCPQYYLYFHKISCGSTSCNLRSLHRSNCWHTALGTLGSSGIFTKVTVTLAINRFNAVTQINYINWLSHISRVSSLVCLLHEGREGAVCERDYIMEYGNGTQNFRTQLKSLYRLQQKVECLYHYCLPSALNFKLSTNIESAFRSNLEAGGSSKQLMCN